MTRSIYAYRDEFDLYFGPLNNLRPRIYDRPTVGLLLDIQEQYFPQYFTSSELIARREAYPELCRAATTVVTISHFCRRSFMEKFGIDGSKIEVIPAAPQHHLLGEDASADEAWQGPPPAAPYFFYPANFYAHKNHALLLDAIEKLTIGGQWSFHVVFVGAEPPAGYPLRREISRRNLGQRCHVLSNLSAGQMRFLYRNALAVVLPTMFEGFGMPAVEAMACGCPLICSDIDALREVAADHALYFQPGNVDHSQCPGSWRYPPTPICVAG